MRLNKFLKKNHHKPNVEGKIKEEEVRPGTWPLVAQHVKTLKKTTLMENR
jgi:hypothetical protein